MKKKLNNEFYTLKYKQLLQIYKNKVQYAKSQNNNLRIQNAANLPKECWKIINESRCKNGFTRHPLILINDDHGNLITNDNIHTCNSFNTHFLEVVKNCPDPNFKDIFFEFVGPSSLFIKDIDVQETREILIKTTKKCSAGIDEIHGKALRHVTDIICWPLSYLINESFKCGEFPQLIKESKCIPLYKGKGDNRDRNNYRSICIQSQISKVFEEAYSRRLVNFLNKYKILNENQHGFRQNRSTQTAIYDCLEYIYKSLNNREHTVGLFYDLSRAFDSIDHKLLLEKLYSVGVRGIPLNWAASYLSNRTQTVTVNGAKSSRANINKGVPQGSILGPLFFIIFTNDVHKCFNGTGYSLLYADDTNTLVSDIDLYKMIDKCNKISNNFNKYCTNNGLILNSQKTALIRFLPKNVSVDYSLYVAVEGQSIRNDNVVKFLGLNLDQKLTWSIHIDILCTKLSSVCFLIRTLRTNVSMDVLRLVYFGLVQSILQYGLISWGSSSHFQKAFNMQKKILRYMINVSPDTSCRPLFRMHNIMSLPNMYIYQLILNIYTNRNKFQLNSDYHSHETRFASDLHLPYSRLTVSQNAPSYLGIKCFNKISKIVPNLDQDNYKNKLRSFLLNNVFYSVKEFLDF